MEANCLWDLPVHITPSLSKGVSDRKRVTQKREGEMGGAEAFWSSFVVVSELNASQWHMCDIRAAQHVHQRNPALYKKKKKKKWGHIFQHQCPTVYRQEYTNTHTHAPTQTKTYRVSRAHNASVPHVHFPIRVDWML